MFLIELNLNKEPLKLPEEKGSQCLVQNVWSNFYILKLVTIIVLPRHLVTNNNITMRSKDRDKSKLIVYVIVTGINRCKKTGSDQLPRLLPRAQRKIDESQTGVKT